MSDDSKQSLIVLSVLATITIIVGGAYLLYQADSANVGQTQTSQPSEITSSDKDENGCYTTATVRSHYGESGCVDFYVGYVYETSAGTKFIDEKVDYQNGFVVYIPRGSDFSTVDLAQFKDRRIKVSGTIQEYNGYPEIEASTYEQVKIYD